MGFFRNLVQGAKKIITAPATRKTKAEKPSRKQRRQAKREAKRQTTPKVTPPVAPPKPDIPPHPRRTPPSPLSVDDRVRRYKAMNPDRRRELRPQDEEAMFWRMYDQGVGE